MNIYQKLVEVRKTVAYLKKDSKGYQFQYVSSSQALGSLRKAMDKHNLLLVPSISDFEIRDHKTAKGAHWYYTILKISFTWINAEKPEETIECFWTGQGLDDGEKGVGKACTYAEKYFLLKFFNIATDKDDPDKFQKQNNGKPETTQKPKQKPEDEQKKQEIIVKLNALLIHEVEAEVPENATSDEKNRMFKEKLKEYSLWNETYAETGKELAKFTLKRVQTIYGKIKEANKGNHPAEIPF